MLLSRRPAVVLLVLAAGGGCLEFPGDFVPPTWDVDISLPLSHTSHSILDLVGDIALLPPEVLDTLDLSKTGGVTYQQTVVLGDTTGDGTDDSDLSENFFHGVSQGTLYVDVENGTPANMEVSVTLLDGSLGSLLTLPTDTTAIFLPAASFDASGKTGPATHALSVVELDAANVQLLSQAEFLCYTIQLSFPAAVRFSNIVNSDSMTIKSWGSFRTRVEP
jgi:hypothetical protein